jgi:hypothetical protein
MSNVLHMMIKIRKFDCSLGVGTKICVLLTYILLELLARFQLENYSAPVRLGSEPSQLGLARAGKFQLKLISTNHVHVWINNHFSIFVISVLHVFDRNQTKKNLHLIDSAPTNFTSGDILTYMCVRTLDS